MLSLIVVDDDPIARKSIITSVEWEKSGFTIIGEAANGRDAFKLVEIQVPDIVITDIKMPVEDGLSFSKKIMRKYPKTRIVLLSGYEDFSYACQAIKIGVKEYLLKPFEVEDLLILVQKLGTEIYREKKTILEENTKNRMIKENFQQMRTQFLNGLINGMNEPESELRSKIEFLGICFEGVYYRLVIIDINEPSKEKAIDLNSIMLLIERTLIEEFNVVTFCNEEGAIVVLLNMKIVNNYRINELFDNLQKEIHQITDSQVNIFMGGTKECFGLIPESYMEAILEKEARNSRYNGIVEKAISFVRQNYQNRIAVEDVAKNLYVSPNYFSKIFKAETGMNFIDYLNRYRVEKAKKIMPYKDLRIYDIAEKVGYQNYKYFNHIFNKYTGSTPQKYRSSI